MPLILVVDDDSMILALLQHRLKRDGHEAMAFASAQEALDAMALASQTRIPDLAILDVMMPIKSGFELCRELRARPGWEDLPVIFLSARVQPQDIEAGHAMGALYLTKPFVASALVKAIDAALQSRGTS
jgi:DNA-binding response OmpR family regulator